jgi:hypothetical protein
MAERAGYCFQFRRPAFVFDSLPVFGPHQQTPTHAHPLPVMTDGVRFPIDDMHQRQPQAQSFPIRHGVGAGSEAGRDGWGELEGFVHELAVTTLQARFERGMDQGIAPVCTQAALIPFMTVFSTLWNKPCVDTNDLSGVFSEPYDDSTASAVFRLVAKPLKRLVVCCSPSAPP